MPWDLLITRPAAKDLDGVPKAQRKRIDAAFEEMRQDPYAGDVRFLRGAAHGTLRRRLGPWRILFMVSQRQRHIVILAVKRRTTTTY
jgi:mRNA-degrading endonuclease RelE of RelBE toxin-antitoxin system